MDEPFEVTLWGCRGSCAANAPGMMQYGCNTSCTSVQCGNKILVLDGGTGILNFERELYAKASGIDKKEIHVFISHYHYDHIEGLPFLKMPYEKDIAMVFYGRKIGEKGCRDVLNQAFSPPYFPIHFVSENSGNLDFIDLQDDGIYRPFQGISVKAIPLNHPGGATGFKVEYGGKSVCYISDYEFEKGSYSHIQPFIDQTDLLIMDSHFSEATYLAGWGHSTWEQSVAVARRESAKRLVLYHHNTDYQDKDLDRISEAVQQYSPNYYVGRDGMKFQL